ncbi:iron-hydroxamate ABC transporter substrate-binding protein [Bacillus xiamenensis]|uniref:Iron-hydroxamate ABC transporter substrate-binding protein n=1 Tax=Bacillus xiamenensis TaxID=1178537 RepID=A0AAC9IHM6_9BACI|nr:MULTISPECIES: ABC transporter substrate-binding protein [Bacillus]AOZ88862.1 iron-hydroxamate ABC transporter substrate-binding protein [Bacillus xiamenensis]MCW1837015.1 ABC transporter substrate-binding protein [Bacillus xiamenensis]QGX64299.1 ABC transporter substrate-binding protein [Bacillus sp. ms-22]
MKCLHVILAGLVLMLLLGGCSQAAPAEKGSGQGALKIKDFSGRTLSFHESPQRIVSLSTGDMSIIYALGGEVVGRPTAELPESLQKAKSVQTIGTTHQFDVELITSLTPDVVLGNESLNKKDISTIEGIGSQLLLTSANSVKDIQRQITLFGDLLGKQQKAQALNDQINQRIKQVKQPQKKVKTLVVYGAPGTYMAALPQSLSGDLLHIAGGVNIAENEPALEKFPQYAQINAEKVIEADPDLILLMTHSNPEDVKAGFMSEMKQNAAWHDVTAVKNGHVEILPNDLFGTNPGAEVIRAIDELEKKLKRLSS